MTHPRPGMNPARLTRLMGEAIRRCGVDLTGAVVLTEAATGPYVVTPVMAAMAGADRVIAVTRNTHYGTVAEVEAATRTLAELAGVGGRIEVVDRKTAGAIGRADIVTNSGHVRPLDAETIGAMKVTAVVPLMYEAWELRAGEVDLAACRARGVRVAGTNERHPHVDVFGYLAAQAIKLLVDAGVPVYRNRILVICDNPFLPYLRDGLTAAGAEVRVAEDLGRAADGEAPDAILIAVKPQAALAIDRPTAARLAGRWPGVVFAQFWGDVDRAALSEAGLPCCPVKEPAAGHMGMLPSAVGPDPVVRLQAGGLKVGEVLWRNPPAGAPAWEYVDAI
jgi:hypothetical protein